MTTGSTEPTTTRSQQTVGRQRELLKRPSRGTATTPSVASAAAGATSVHVAARSGRRHNAEQRCACAHDALLRVAVPSLRGEPWPITFASAAWLLPGSRIVVQTVPPTQDRRRRRGPPGPPARGLPRSATTADPSSDAASGSAAGGASPSPCSTIWTSVRRACRSPCGRFDSLAGLAAEEWPSGATLPSGAPASATRAAVRQPLTPSCGAAPAPQLDGLLVESRRCKWCWVVAAEPVGWAAGGTVPSSARGQGHQELTSTAGQSCARHGTPYNDHEGVIVDGPFAARPPVASSALLSRSRAIWAHWLV
jgi:hypothetical protein